MNRQRRGSWELLNIKTELEEQQKQPRKAGAQESQKLMPTNSSSMTRSMKTLLIIAASTCFVVYAITNLFPLSIAFSSTSSLSWRPEPQRRFQSSVTESRGGNAVKIYMYDLPRKFTFGVIEEYLKARGVSDGDSASIKYPGNQHTAEWWLFEDLSRPSRTENSAVMRTLNPEEADLFYVPFFSSLSLIVNPKLEDAESGLDRYNDERMQEELLQWLQNQPYWHRFRGRDHVLICQDPNALYKIVDELKNAMLLLSDFGRMRKDQGSLVKDVILPYSHRINSYKGDIGVDHRRSLLFFMGNRFRKEGGKVRDLLFQVLEDEEDMIIKHGTQSRESRRLATQGMHTSKFCLHPAGDTPSACRLFDAIVSLCVPVVVSDDIELPFEDMIDYSKIAVFVSSDNAVQRGFLASLLRNMTDEEILRYQRELKKVKYYFEYEEPDGAVQAIWHQVVKRVPLIKLMINRDKRLVERKGLLDCSCICPNGKASLFNATQDQGLFP